MATDEHDLETRDADRRAIAAIAKFEAVFNQSGIFAGIMDLDGTLREVNDLAVEGCGYTREQVLGRPFWDTPWWRGSDAIQERIRVATRAAAAGAVFREELPYWVADGSERDVDFAMHPIRDPSGQVTHLHPTGIDITERKRTEQALRESEKKFAALFHTSPTAMALADQEEGRIEDVNQAWLSMMGFSSREEVIGKTSIDLGLVHDRTQRAKIFSDFRQMRMIRNREIEALDHNGKHRTMLVSVIPVTYGGRTFLFSTNLDITARKQAEEALRDADRRKDEFLATLAHELRNPLAPIRNAAEILKAKGHVESAVVWSRDVIERQVSQMSRLLDDLLDLNRISRGKIELRKSRITLAAAVELACETSRPLIEESGHTLTLSLPEKSVLLEGDLVRLAQVFSNLLNNAATYTPSGGRIRLSGDREGNEVIVRVRDNGVGLTPEMLARVFEMFAQAETAGAPTRRGLGIGLSLVKGLVELHGGTISAESDGPGKGTEFVVRLPVAEPEASQTPPAKETGKSAAPRSRILVVDDLHDSADSLAVILSAAGHEVHTAYDGETALAAAQKLEPDVAFVDLGMPRISGYEVCRRMREQPWGRRVYVVALTGWGQEDDHRRTAEAGFDAHLVKPVEPAALLDVLASGMAARRT